MSAYDVVGLGELLVDFTSVPVSTIGREYVFQANPGGAPCNVLAMLSRLGKKTAFIGKVGRDFFGRMLRQSLIDAGVDPIGLAVSDEAPTTLAFIQNDKNGDREFSFYRNPGADTLLSADDIDARLLTRTRLFHFGSVSMTHPSSRRATFEAVKKVSNANIPISFDPNIRMALWNNPSEIKEQVALGCQVAQILKISTDELYFLTESNQIEAGLEVLLQRFAPFDYIFITDGRQGSYAWHEGMFVHSPTFLGVSTIDTTGAGDTFFGTCLNGILDLENTTCSAETLISILQRANAAASLVTTRQGALAVMPSAEEIDCLLCGN